jgi:cytochrome c553
MMTRIRLKMAALTIIVCAAPSLADAETANIANCTWCHGVSGQGDSIAPRLAGQRPRYIENQLMSFGDHTRDNPFSQQYMWGAVAALSTKDGRYLAAYFSTLPPKAANDGNSELAAAGRTIYEAGIPNSNVAACAACHGPNAEGIREIPRLGGLSHSYVKRRLEQWGEGYHAAAGSPMPRIAGKLSRDIIDAVASYLSFVK